MTRQIKKADADGIFWPQDPSANLDYAVNWASALTEASTTIASAIWSVSPTGPTLHTKSFSTTEQITWVSGIEDGTTYTLAGKIIGADGLYKNRQIFRIKGSEGGQ